MIVLVGLETPWQDAQDCSGADAISKEKATFEIFKSDELLFTLI
jgi:hypothetical protein